MEITGESNKYFLQFSTNTKDSVINFLQFVWIKVNILINKKLDLE